MSDDVTLDPLSASLRSRSPMARPMPVVEILHHPDLSRVGDQTLPDPFDQPVVFGRSAPGFADSEWRERPLADPCLSRDQFRLVWRDGCFDVRPSTDSRRGLRAFGDEGEARPLGRLPPGSLLAIGDRVLLRLGLRRLRRASADRRGLLGETETAWALREEIRAAAGSGTTMVLGETGVGKELVARALHAASGRRGELVAVNCAALSAELVEAELFGHVRGAFTGAADAREGLFRAADGGTLLLDEVGELPLSVQAKLLRVLQERTVRPVGGTREVAVDVQVVAATLRDLPADVAAGRFRADLYGRIESPCVRVPPLRARRADIPRLFFHFLRESGGAEHLWRPADQRPPAVPLALTEALLAASWPRNVRQLLKYAEAVARANRNGDPFSAPPVPGTAGTTSTPTSTPVRTSGTRAPVDADTLWQTLVACDFSQQRTAETLGVARTTLHRWMALRGFPRPKDLDAPGITAALAEADGDLTRAAEILRVSPRGLQLRATALGIDR